LIAFGRSTRDDRILINRVGIEDIDTDTNRKQGHTRSDEATNPFATDPVLAVAI
jgi:hypothetical protein